MWVADRRGPNIPYPPPIPENQTLPSILSTKEMENTFIDGLVEACSCRNPTRTIPVRSPPSSPLFTYHRARRRDQRSTYRQFCTAVSTHLEARSRSKYASVSREEYRQMLDYYREPYDTSDPSAGCKPPPLALPIVNSQQGGIQHDEPMTSQSESARGQRIGNTEDKAAANEGTSRDGHSGSVCHRPRAASDDVISSEVLVSSVEGETPEPDSTASLFELHTRGKLQALKRLQHFLGEPDSTHEQIYEAYNQLPSPGVKYLDYGDRCLLFHRLSVVEVKSKKAMLRFLNLVDDMKEASIPLHQAEWNSAIAYAGRCFVRVGASEVESALRIWKEMEQKAGVQSGSVTFNILFDIATKAEKYVLAEMILKEMGARELEYTRFSHVGFIYYHGLKGNGAGVRKAYRDYVEAGEIVDTTVMNCVIASLIRAGEPSAAEQVYERMKRLLYRKTGQAVPSSDWRHWRDLGRALDKASRTLRNNPDRLERLQAEQCLAPNLRTFSIFIDYHIYTTGELRPVTAFLHEMHKLSVPMHGRIFLRVFQGFARHGGVRYTSWTTQRLETVWTSLLTALDERIDGVHIRKWMVVWVVRAFAKCCGRERALQIWEETRDRWKVSDVNERGAVEHLLRDVLKEGGREKRHGW